MKTPLTKVNYYCNLIVLLFFVLFLNLNLNAQALKAFPSAEGAGSEATGGRQAGTQILHVTRLDDDPDSNTWQGTLRWALRQRFPRIIVFDVSGTINLVQSISMGGQTNLNDWADCTVLGQTAPEGGITITGNGRINFEYQDNIILRYLKFRNGNYGSETKGLRLVRGQNFIVDHCEFYYGTDEGLGTGGANDTFGNITIQNCLFADSKTGLITGTSWSGQLNWDETLVGNVSILKNTFINISHRFPKAGGIAHFDIINNVIHNWGFRLMRFDPSSFTLNEINNYYQSGSNSGNNLNQLFSRSWMSPQIYTNGNFMSEDRKPIGYDEDNSLSWEEFNTQDGNSVPFNSNWFVNNQLNLNKNTDSPLTAVQARQHVLDNSGTRHYLNADGSIGTYIDNLTLRYLNYLETDSDVGKLDYQSEYGEQAVNVPNNTRPSNYYMNSPHLPEAWFSVNVPAGQTATDLSPSGYLWIEEFANGVDNPVIVTEVDGVEVSPIMAEVQIPETITLAATFIPANATNKNGTWSSSDDSIATVDQNGVVTPISNGVVTITFTTTDGGFTDTSEITVFPEALQASAGDDQQVCEGETISLTASGGTTYLWSTGETTATIEVTPNETTTYTVTVSDDLGQSDEDAVIVTVNDIPVANAGEDQTICEGDSLTLTASGGNEYIWSNGETTASITVNPSIETIYTVEVISNNCSSTDAVNIGVNPSPEVTLDNDLYIYNGDSVTLTAGGADTYQWNNGETTNTIVVTPSETTTYTVTGFANGCQRSVEVTVTVLEPINANAGDDVTICSGDSVTLNATGGSSYSWNSGETVASINVSPIETTIYAVTVTDELGSTDTDSVTVTVNETPTVTVSDDITIMDGESVTLTSSGAETYLWNTGETTDLINVSPTSTTTYTVTGYSNSCESSAQVTVTVIPELIANAGNDVTICNGESVTLNASGGINYSWNTGDTGASLTFSPTVTTTYTVTVTDNFGNTDSDSVTVTVNETPNVTVSENVTIIEGESTSLTAQGADSYLWSTGETSSLITVSPTQTTTYIVEGTTATCSAQAQVTVTVEAIFQASAGTDERVCDDSTYELVLSANQGDSYLWSTGETSQSIVVSPLSTTTYTVTVSQGQQEDTDDVTVYVDPSPNVTIDNGESVDILNGDFITLTASGANTYEWNNGATQPNIAVSPSTTTTYEVKGFIGNCYDEKQVTVNVFQPVVANAGENVSICLDEIATLTASGGDEYVWNTGEITQSIQVSPSETTQYTVTVFNAMDFDEASVMVDVDANCDSQPAEIGQESLDFMFDIFPNPASNLLNLKLSGTSLSSNVYIFDITGKLIMRTEISNDDASPRTTRQIDIGGMQSGVYIVKLIDQEREIIRKLIVR